MDAPEPAGVALVKLIQRHGLEATLEAFATAAVCAAHFAQQEGNQIAAEGWSAVSVHMHELLELPVVKVALRRMKLQPPAAKDRQDATTI
jgi:hypothetical protein